MEKIAIILDSFSGRSKAEINKLGWEHVHQSIILDGQSYADGVDIFLEKDGDKIANARDIKTSMPPIGIVEEAFTRLSARAEKVVFLPMNRSISGTYDAAAAAAKNFPNVTVVANTFYGTALVDAAKYVEKSIKGGADLDKTITKIEKYSEQSFVYVIPKTIDGLIKSGRVTGLKRIILEKAKLIPILYVGVKGFEVKGVKRNFEKAIASACDEAVKNINGRIADFCFEIIHCGNKASIAAAEHVLKENGINDYAITWANAPIAGHAGLAAVGINVFPKMI